MGTTMSTKKPARTSRPLVGRELSRVIELADIKAKMTRAEEIAHYANYPNPPAGGWKRRLPTIRVDLGNDEWTWKGADHERHGQHYKGTGSCGFVHWHLFSEPWELRMARTKQGM